MTLGADMIEALERRDSDRLRRLVPERYWGWLDDYLSSDRGWRSIDEIAGAPRSLKGARQLAPGTARFVVRGPVGDAFITATFDDNQQLKGFALDVEEYEGIGTIVIACPPKRKAEISAFYDALIRPRPRRRPQLGFGEGGQYQAPQWPDPQHPQQMHLDVHVSDIDETSGLVEKLGATHLADFSDHRVFADPIGHPFCLYHAENTRLWRVVIDCPEPDELASFYRAFLGEPPVPQLSFQRVSPYVSPRWPNPTFPAQMHFDIKVDDRRTMESLVVGLGAVPLPAQGGSCPVFADPAGHPFCLCVHGE